jgi:superfamily I DNA and/or RNA helicase
MAIIVPYFGQQSLNKEAIDQLSGRGGISLEGLIVVTADSFQGWERSIIFWDVVSGPHTGSDPRRICVSITRHTDIFFWLSLQTKVVGKGRGSKVVVDAEDGES